MRNIFIETNYYQQLKDISSNPKILKLYTIIEKGLKLNNDTLSIYFPNQKDIQELIDLSILIPTENNEYKISFTKELYNYGLKSLIEYKVLRAINCFNQCLKSEPTNIEYYQQLILIYLKERNYKEAINLLSTANKIIKDEYQNEYILYLYLLNMITPLEEEYIKQIENLNIDELIQSHNKDKYDIEIYRNISSNKFKFAFKLLNDKIRLQDKYSVKDELLRELLYQTINKDEYYKNNLRIAVKNNNLDKVISLIDIKKQQRYLNNNETYIYLITKSLLEITKTKIIPIPKITTTTYLYEAIKGNNFQLAETINNQFLEKMGKSKEEDSVAILLTRINARILEIKLNIENEIKEEHQEEIPNNQEQLKKENNNQEEDKQLISAEELATYIKIQNLSIETARKQLGIIPSQILLIKLIFARDYYMEELYEYGDELVKAVEKSKDKTEIVKKYLNEVRNNKKFYKNRKNTYTKKLIP